MANVFIYDEFGPEDTAMMQALYSRSPKSVTEHVEKVRRSGSGKFMSTFYVGYGHASIADCGSTTIFIEGLSILADKAIQDWPLYSGQETSTRYIDMAKQAIIDPINTPESSLIIKNWMDFYVSGLEKIKPYLKEKYPRQENEEEKIYNKAINARAFDIMRGFLPAGITTQLSWHSNLRQAWDKLALMRHHPLPEVKKVAETILAQLKEKYPDSFSHELVLEQEDYRKMTIEKYTYFAPENKETPSFRHSIDKNELNKYNLLFSSRPPKIGLPYWLGDLGQIHYDFILDFGSYRDIQRHRSAIIRVPLLTTKLGFQSWYLEQLPPDLLKEAKDLIAKQNKAITALNTDDNTKQYYIAMGFNVFCQLTAPLPGAVYIAELRSGKMVHPSLRRVAHQLCRYLNEYLPEVKLHADMDQDNWDIRRGANDIISKE